MIAADGERMAGICHQQGFNADIPSQWMVYISVADLDESMRACKAGGGKVVAGPKDIGAYGRYCVIQDPAGAVCALIQSPDEESDETSE